MPSPPRESDQHYDLERFFNFAIDLFCIADTKGYFRRVNPAFTRVLGYTPEELVSIPFVDLVHPDDREQTLAEVGKLAGGQVTLSFENRYRCKDGSYKYLHWTSYPEPQTGLLYAVARDITDRKLREDRIDGITGLPNRRVWDEALRMEWRRAARVHVPLAAALLDVDHLRAFNEVHGHLEGDRALRQIAGLVADWLRRTGDLAARFYGGTLGLLFVGGLDVNDAAALCEEMRQAVHDLELDHPNGADGRLTVSAGVASMIPPPGDATDTLQQEAQAALRHAKEHGRNRVEKASAP